MVYGAEKFVSCYSKPHIQLERMVNRSVRVISYKAAIKLLRDAKSNVVDVLDHLRLKCVDAT